MRKPTSLTTYPESRLVGLHASTEARKHQTVERLRQAIESLKAQHKAITVQTIYEESGLYYASIARNPEALALFRASSTHLNQPRKRKQRKRQNTDTPTFVHDPLMSYKKPQLVTRLRAAMQHIQHLEQQQATLLETYLQKESHLQELEAQLAELEPYRSFVEELRTRIRREEQSGGTTLP